MFSSITTAVLYGIDARLIYCEADICEGLPVFEMVGFLSTEVRESKERIKTALKNCGYNLPTKKITINLSPANIKKNGTGFDLPVAVAILHSLGIINDNDILKETLIVGEIGLNGNVSKTLGILPIVLEAKKCGYKRVILPTENLDEGSLVGGIEIIPVNDINEVINFLNNKIIPTNPTKESNDILSKLTNIPDFCDINGQEILKRACEVAVSGMHNLLMIGPPGAGKTMIAKRIPGILPPMTLSECLEVSKIYSVCGLLREENGLIYNRPFRNPHHTISPQGLAGGGSFPRPGEISLSHKGVLFLDELTEFNKTTLEILRQPMEDKKITISRSTGSFEFPADYLLVAAMNPCSCGYYPNRNKCHCSSVSIHKYLSKISRPLLDRIDICTEASQITYNELVNKNSGESSGEIKERVLKACEKQKERFKYESFLFNSQIPSGLIDEYCPLGDKELAFLRKKYEKLDLSARSYHKILKVSRTIADMDDSKDIKVKHLVEAISYRGPDKSYWEV